MRGGLRLMVHPGESPPQIQALTWRLQPPNPTKTFTPPPLRTHLLRQTVPVLSPSRPKTPSSAFVEPHPRRGWGGWMVQGGDWIVRCWVGWSKGGGWMVRGV